MIFGEYFGFRVESVRYGAQIPPTSHSAPSWWYKSDVMVILW